MNELLAMQELINFEIEEYSSSLRFKKPASLYEPISYTLNLGGKRTRPLLTLMACDLFDGNIKLAINAAVGIELFHNFTLLHDDIMDKAPLRRNMPTVHQKWNSDIAILSGDTLFVQSFQFVMKTPAEHLKEVVDLFAKTAVEVCEGQQLDMDFESQTNVGISSYIKMITLKTSVLLAASMQVGAIIGGARPEDAAHIYEFGKNLGIAFQLHDDILDVFGNSTKVGKQSGGDIVSNKKTYLLLKAMEVADRYRKEELELWMYSTPADPKEKVEAVKSIYEYLGVKNLAEAEMQKYYNKSIEAVDLIPCNKQKKQALKHFAEALMQRES